MSEEKLVPKLRFSGFDDEWKSCRFDELFDFQVAGDMKKELFNEEFIDEYKYPLYANALENEGLLGYYKEYKYNPNSITVTARGNIGHATARKNKFNAVGRLIILTPKEDLNIEFFTEYINNNVKIYIESTGVPQLTAPSLKINKLHYPTLNEQNKISNLLIMLNNKIELLGQKHQLYQYFKKYLMQQIFTQKLRFKSADGEQYSDWKERNLYEFLTEHKLKSTGNEEVYSVSVHKGLVNQKEHLGRDFSAPDTSKYNLVKPGDIVYTKSPTGDFPLGIIKQSRVDKNVIVSPLYGVFTPETYALGYILNDYFESNVNTHNYLHPIVQKGAKNTMNITNKTFLSKTLFVPTDVNEQQKIAECFSKVNDSIRNIEIQQNKVNEFKKGLLQQMFVVQLILSLLQNKKHI